MVGFPHSEILGSKLIRSSPRLIAAYYVLHRLHAPRHPLNALKALDRSHYQCPQTAIPPLENRTRSRTERSSHRLIDVMVLIGQIKNNQISRDNSVPRRGCRLKRSRTSSLNDVERSGQIALQKENRPAKLCSLPKATFAFHIHSKEWWSQTGSNRRPHACKARALPTELWPLGKRQNRTKTWWARVDSNYRPHAYQACALTT